jgi:NDP-sugar pyrophosphorylase family protein
MKAIIPVAGAGTKLRPHTYTQPKALIPLAGKTILSIIIDQLKEAGINEFVFIQCFAIQHDDKQGGKALLRLKPVCDLEKVINP